MNPSIEYRNFCENIRKAVELRLGNDYYIMLHTVTKNNNIKLDGLIIRKLGTQLMPSIYLNRFYEEYLSGTSFDAIVEELLCLYEEHRLPPETTISFAYEDVCKYIYFQLISYPRNKEMLNEMPHCRIGEFAVTLQCVVFHDETRLGTVQVTNEHCSLWDISEAEILSIAAENTRRDISPILRTMEDVIEDILWEGMRNCCKEKNEATMAQVEDMLQLLLHRKEGESIPMYVLSSSVSSHGASSLLAIPHLDHFQKMLGEDFYILPSSIHEAILVPESKAPCKDKLSEMVREINGSQVPEQEFLSDEVYLYSEFRELIPEPLRICLQ